MRIKEREKELSDIPIGVTNKRKSSINFNFPDTPPYTPSTSSPPPDDFSRYLAPSNFSRYLELSPHFLQPTEPRETSFLFSDGNQPESLAPLKINFEVSLRSPQNQLLTTLQDQSLK